MNLLKLSFKNLISKPLNLVLCLLLLSLSIAIISIIGQAENIIKKQFLGQLKNIDLVVGATGSPLQLILSAVYHIDNPTGNISIQDAQKLSKQSLIEFAVPLSYGDNYNGHHIVGSIPQYLDLFEGKLEKGNLWEQPFEIVVGYQIAEKYQLDLGDEIVGSHGLSNSGMEHEDEPYKIVGILSPSSSVLDQLILTSLESIWHAHEEEEHESDEDEHNHEHDHNHDEDSAHTNKSWLTIEEDNDITALLIKTRSPLGLIQLPRYVNENTKMQAASPLYEMNRLTKLLGSAFVVIEVIAYIIMLVAGISIFISLYSKLKEKRVELAFMRLNGAKRWHLVNLLLLESFFLSVIGFVIGIIFSRIFLIVLSQFSTLNISLKESLGNFNLTEIYLLILSIAIGLIAAIIPAVEAFSLNISKTLRHE